jgi:hypothetical protein
VGSTNLDPRGDCREHAPSETQFHCPRTLTRTAGGDKALNKAKQRYTNHLKKMKSKALRQYQEHWVRGRRDWKILTRGRGVAQDRSKTDFVQNICLLIPERGRLAQKMAADQPLEPGEMWQALQDLHALCVQDFTVLYLPRSRPPRWRLPH